jgi:hypothetical protein
MILTSNRGLPNGATFLEIPVVASCFTHAVVVHIEGASYRLRQDEQNCCAGRSSPIVRS